MYTLHVSIETEDDETLYEDSQVFDTPKENPLGMVSNIANILGDLGFDSYEIEECVAQDCGLEYSDEKGMYVPRGE